MNKKGLLAALLVLLAALAGVVVYMLVGGGTAQKEPEKQNSETQQAERVWSEEITDIFKHCLSVTEKNDGYYPFRFSTARLEDYKNYPVIPYSGCTAGVTMELTTDADEISFNYILQKKFWKPSFDVWENGEYKTTVECGDLWGHFKYEKESDGEADIVIVMPIDAETIVKDLSLGSFKTDVTGDKKKVLILGDSISQGLYGAGSSKNWVFLLSQKQNFDYLNLSVGGETFRAEALDEIDFEPDRIVIALGTNDFYYTRYLNQIEINMKAYFDRVEELYPDVPVTVICPFWERDLAYATDSADKIRFEDLCTMILTEAEARGYQALDGRELVPNDQAYFEDGVHPNAEGFAAMTEKLNEVFSAE